MKYALVTLFVLVAVSGAFAWEPPPGFMFVTGDKPPTVHFSGLSIGSWSTMTDGYDRVGDSVGPSNPAYAMMIYHDEPDWTGPHGWYRSDNRALLQLGETKIWDNIYLWQRPSWGLRTFQVGFAGYNYPPPDWSYTLYLDYAPPEANWIGPWQWSISPTQVTSLTFPAVESQTGLTGYRFHFTIVAVPEPGSLVALGGGLAGVGALVFRRRKR